jgi:hypothetical protein
MPAGITHVVETRYRPGGGVAYVLLAIEANPPGHYLEANLLYQEEDGSWRSGDSAGAGFTDRTLEDLRAEPPRQGLFDSPVTAPWARDVPAISPPPP